MEGSGGSWHKFAIRCNHIRFGKRKRAETPSCCFDCCVQAPAWREQPDELPRTTSFRHVSGRNSSRTWPLVSAARCASEGSSSISNRGSSSSSAVGYFRDCFQVILRASPESCLQPSHWSAMKPTTLRAIPFGSKPFFTPNSHQVNSEVLPVRQFLEWLHQVVHN